MGKESKPTFQPASSDSYSPAEIAKRVVSVGVSKAKQDFWSTFALSVLAGAFISLGAIFATTAISESNLGFGLTRVVGGLVFSLGLILVVIAGAELFTGNNLIVMAWVSGKVKTAHLLRNWLIVYLGNFAGAMATVGFMFIARQYSFGNYAIAETALSIANSKVNLGFLEAFILGIFCNALVCLAVWLCMSARTTTDKILSILFPITAFVAAGFEHSVANMYFIPMGILIESDLAAMEVLGVSSANFSALNMSGFLENLIPVSLGNIVGGGLLVAAVYWFIYLRNSD
jgi:formate/nitrite transporter